MKYNLITAACIVVANMVGTGIFTSLGFQLPVLHNINTIALLWILGGVIALLGSFCYAELSASYPQSGGEYHFLRISLGNGWGFLSGWTSAIAGFAAPIAASSIAFAKYFATFYQTEIPTSAIALMILLVITIINTLHFELGAGFQVFFTIGKVLLLVAFVVFGFWYYSSTPSPVLELSTAWQWRDLFSSGFWIALIYVSYAYSGWNATAYIIEDIKEPVKNVPRSIFLGMIIVMFLYVLLNIVFMITTPASVMSGKPEVAHEAARYIFGPTAASVISALISFFLISTINSMIIVGPRVMKRIADDYPPLTQFANNTRNGVPLKAIILQSGIAAILILSTTLEFIITTIGFLLSIFTTLTVIGLMVLRTRQSAVERKLKTPFYPITPILFILFNVWTMLFLAVNRHQIVIAGFVFLLLGFLVYRYFDKTKKNKLQFDPKS